MNKAKRKSIITLLTKLGYTIVERDGGNRLHHFYSVTKDGVHFSLYMTNEAIQFNKNDAENRNSVCTYALLLKTGGNVAYGKEHELYKTFVDLSWELRDLLNIQIPTIIL